MSQLSTAAQTSRVHQLAHQVITNSGDVSKANDELRSMGVSVANTGSGGARINYGREYMKMAGIQKANASNDGQYLFATMSGARDDSILRSLAGATAHKN